LLYILLQPLASGTSASAAMSGGAVSPQSELTESGDSRPMAAVGDATSFVPHDAKQRTMKIDAEQASAKSGLNQFLYVKVLGKGSFGKVRADACWVVHAVL